MKLWLDELRSEGLEFCYKVDTESDSQHDTGMAKLSGSRAGSIRQGCIPQLLSKLESYWSTLYTQSIRSYVN